MAMPPTLQPRPIVQPQPSERMSKLAAALAESFGARALHQYPESGLLGGKCETLTIRVPTKLETDQAIVDAHAYVESLAGKLEAAKSDEDLLRDTKSAAIVAKALRDSDDPAFPAFPSADFVQRHLTSDKIAALVHLLNDARDREPGAQVDVSRETISMLVASARWLSSASREHAIAFFARMNRERLIELVLALASLLGPEDVPAAEPEAPQEPA